MAILTNGDESDNSESSSDSDSAPQFMTVEQFNKAFTGRMKGFESKIASTLDSFTSQLASKFEPPKAEQGDDDADSSKAKGDFPPEVANQLKAMKARMTKLESDNKSLRDARDQEAQHASVEKMRRLATDGLSKHGIEGQRASHAIGHLVDVTGRIRLGADGKPVFFNGEYEESLDEGLESWARSDEAALYRPPKPNHGSGERGGSANLKPGESARDAAIRALEAII